MTENKRFNSYCDNENIRIRIDDDIKNKEVFHIYFAELDDALYCKSKLNPILDCMNELHEENNLLKDIIKDIVVQLDANHTSHTYQMTIPINKVIYNELKRRLKETSFNEELRRFLE